MSHSRETGAGDDDDTERVIVNIDGLEELTAIRESLDGIREDFDWWLKNHRREQWLPMQPITSMPVDPLAPDWAERLNRFSAADLSENLAPDVRQPQPQSDNAIATEGRIDDETQFCCDAPNLQWTGDPQFPGVACQNCGYIVADCGSVVMHPSPQADPDPPSKELVHPPTTSDRECCP
ncbi:MAG TPA: hypothetical protein VFI31_28865 [Pirellulales bacterium]|nr:hypothetical protein [Pirellulales bacterium]